MWRSRLRFLGLWLAGSLLLGLLQALYFGYAATALDIPPVQNFNFIRSFLSQTIRYAVWPALLPLMAVFVRAYPLGRDLSESSRAITWYILSLPLWAAAHCALMVLCDYPLGLTVPGRSFYVQWVNVMAGPLIQNTAVGALLLLILATRDYQARLRAQDRAEEELRTAAASARLAAALNLAQPTVFFPSLQSISALIPQEPARAVELVDRLGEFLRLSLQGSSRTTVELREELDLLRRYLAVEEIRRASAPQLEVDFPPAARDCLLPARVLLPVAAQLLRDERSGPLCLTVDLPTPERPGQLRLHCPGVHDLGALQADESVFTALPADGGMLVRIPLVSPPEEPEECAPLPALPRVLSPA